MIDRGAILRRLDEERRRLARDGEIIDVLRHVTRLRAGEPPQYVVIYSSLLPDNADDVIAGEIEHHRRLGVQFEWKVYAHDRPADLLERLRRHGFEVGPCEAVMVYDLSDRGGWISEGDAQTHKVVRMERLDQLADFRRVAEEVFGKDYSFTINQLTEAIRAGSRHHVGYVAYAAGEPVSVGRLYMHPQSHFAGLYGGGTLAAYRGKGFYRAMVAARARDAVAQGAKYLVVDALPSSRPILERMGFERVTDTWPCEWRP
jgi:hypothetical protein